MNVFEILREQIPVHSVIPLDGHGRKVLCISPGHSEAEPSMHVYEDHVHCFGCGFHADVTDVWRIMHRFEKSIDAALDLAREFNIRVPEFSEEAAQKAEGRRNRTITRPRRTTMRPCRSIPASSSGGRAGGSPPTSATVSSWGLPTAASRRPSRSGTAAASRASSAGNCRASRSISSRRPKSSRRATAPCSSRGTLLAARSWSRDTSTPWRPSPLGRPPSPSGGRGSRRPR